jgi:hypothetical protein
VFELVAVFPLSISTVIVAVTALEGRVNVYHTSLVVPQVLVAIPSLVALYKSPLEAVPQVKRGVSASAEEQSLFEGWEKTICETRRKMDRKTECRAVGFIVLDLK